MELVVLLGEKSVCVSMSLCGKQNVPSGQEKVHIPCAGVLSLIQSEPGRRLMEKPGAELG